VCRTPSVHTGIGSILNFLWSGVKLAIWLSAFLLTITCVVNVQMTHARTFSTSTLQGLFNDIKNTSRQGVLTSAIKLWNCKSLGGLQVSTFGGVSLIFTLASKWGCDKYDIYWTTYNAKHTFFGVCSCVMGIETYGFVIENVDINIYIGFLEVFICLGNWSVWYFNNKIWTIASRYKLFISVVMVIWYNKSRWIYLQLAISLSSFLEPELCR
jgi:hypothetical protein